MFPERPLGQETKTQEGESKMLTAVGCVLVILIVACIMTNKSNLISAFIILPIIGALICGFGLKDIAGFIRDGLSSVLVSSSLFAFAIFYFSILGDVGMFDVIIQKLLRFLGNKVEAVLFLSLVVVMISHLDGSGATTILVTVSTMLPLYKKMNIRPLALLLILALGVSFMNLTPWSAAALRLATTTGVEAVDLWRMLVPIQVAGFVVAAIIVLFLARIEKKNGAGLSDAEFNELKAGLMKDVEVKVSKPVLYFDIILTVVLIVVLLTGKINSLMGFMIALAVMLLVNFKTPKEQNAMIRKHGSTVMYMVIILFSIGVMVGIMSGTGMIESMANSFISILPESMGPHLVFILALLAFPLGMVMGSDPIYYVIAPVMAQVIPQYGGTNYQLAAALIVGTCCSMMVCPVGPTPYLALGMVDESMQSHMKYSVPWMFLFAVVMAFCMGVFGIIKF